MVNQLQSELDEQMAKKLAILEKISINTKFQLQFIQQRKLKGLLRLLRERAQYLQELADLNHQVNSSKNNSVLEQTANEAVNQIALMIKAKEQEIISDNNQALQAIMAEQGHIIADLQRVRAQKNLRNSYDMRWIKITGNQLNQRV